MKGSPEAKKALLTLMDMLEAVGYFVVDIIKIC